MKRILLDETLGFLIYRVHIQGVAALRKALQAGGLDVTPEQLSVLGRIWEREGINQNQLAQKVFKDRHNMTRILVLLEKKGHIERRPDVNDNRAYRLYLSDSGRSLLEKAAPVVLRHWKQRVEGLTPEDITSLKKILTHLSGNLEKVLARLY